jgi:hypothetical protein
MSRGYDGGRGMGCSECYEGNIHVLAGQSASPKLVLMIAGITGVFRKVISLKLHLVKPDRFHHLVSGELHARAAAH